MPCSAPHYTRMPTPEEEGKLIFLPSNSATATRTPVSRDLTKQTSGLPVAAERGEASLARKIAFDAGEVRPDQRTSRALSSAR